MPQSAREEVRQVMTVSEAYLMSRISFGGDSTQAEPDRQQVEDVFASRPRSWLFRAGIEVEVKEEGALGLMMGTSLVFCRCPNICLELMRNKAKHKHAAQLTCYQVPEMRGNWGDRARNAFPGQRTEIITVPLPPLLQFGLSGVGEGAYKTCQER